jgi:4-amino-4-deoxy-L-arabinose transferase-like glycosyltransferase
MIETGDYVDIRYQDDVRYRKPVGIYWLQASVVNVTSALGLPNAHTSIWLYRLPSLIGVIAADRSWGATTSASASRSRSRCLKP